MELPDSVLKNLPQNDPKTYVALTPPAGTCVVNIPIKINLLRIISTHSDILEPENFEVSEVSLYSCLIQFVS